MLTPLEKQQAFAKELKELLVKYNAEILTEDFGGGYLPDIKIVVDFKWDQALCDAHGTGGAPQLIIGTFENGLD